MANEWTEERFGSLVRFVSDKSQAKDASIDTYISTENMVADFGGISPASALPLTGSITKFKVGDTLFSNIRTYFKKVWQAQFDGCCSNDVLVLRPSNEDALAPDYLHQICRWEKFTELSIRTSKGAKMPRGDKDALADFKFRLPPIEEQRAIAHILGTLDDKIELNRKQNKTLEAMARALFKAWFVDFEPVRAKLEGRWQRGQSLPGLPAHLYDLFPERLAESELGEIPEGWGISDFGAVSLCLDKHRIPLSSKQRESKKGLIPYHGATSVMDFVDEYIFDGVYLLLGEDGSVLKEDGTPFIQYIWGKSWVNNHAHVLKGKNGVSTEHLMLFMASQNITAYVTGAVQLKLNQKNMNSIPFVKASTEINSEFSKSIASLFDQYRQLSEQSRSLAQIRDTLLPKLISGELRVPDAERIFEEASP